MEMIRWKAPRQLWKHFSNHGPIPPGKPKRKSLLPFTGVCKSMGPYQKLRQVAPSTRTLLICRIDAIDDRFSAIGTKVNALFSQRHGEGAAQQRNRRFPGHRFCYSCAFPGSSDHQKEGMTNAMLIDHFLSTIICTLVHCSLESLYFVEGLLSFVVVDVSTSSTSTNRAPIISAVCTYPPHQ